MTKLFADIGYWIALIDPQDDLHQRATLLTTSLAPTKIVTTEMILTEVLNAFSKCGDFYRQSAVTLIRGIRRNPNIEIIAQTSELFNTAFDLYSQRPDQS
jgi:hypothetical protein